VIDALENYALVLKKTKRKAQAELLETRAMVYRAKLKEHRRKLKFNHRFSNVNHQRFQMAILHS